MVTDPDKMEAVMSEPYILVTDRKIASIHLPLAVKEIVDALPAGHTQFILTSSALISFALRYRARKYSSEQFRMPYSGLRGQDILIIHGDSVNKIVNRTNVSDDMLNNIPATETISAAGIYRSIINDTEIDALRINIDEVSPSLTVTVAKLASARWYSGYSPMYARFRLQGFHLLRLSFPARFFYLIYT